MCTYTCSKALSLQNHKQKCKDNMDVMDTNEIVNNNAEQVTETNITETTGTTDTTIDQ